METPFFLRAMNASSWRAIP